MQSATELLTHNCSLSLIINSNLRIESNYLESNRTIHLISIMINQVPRFCSLNTTRSSSSISSNKSNKDSSDRIKKTETKKRVRFYKKVKVKSTIHIKHYTNQEIEACWYTPAEYNNIIEGMYLTLDLMKISLAPYNCLFSNSSSSSKCKDDKSSSLSSLYCSRGLENLSIEGGLKHSTRIRRQNAIWSVLDEQNVQYEEAILQRTLIYDVVKISNAYRYHTRIPEKKARSMGRIDAADQESLSASSSALLIELDNSMNGNCEDDETSSVSSYSSLETTIVAASTTQSSAPITIITYDSKNSSSDDKKNHLSYRRGGPTKRRWSFVNTRVQSCIPLCA